MCVATRALETMNLFFALFKMGLHVESLLASSAYLFH